MNLTLQDRRPLAKDVEPEMSPLFEANRQGIDYGERANVQVLHAPIDREQGDVRLTIKPFPLWVLVACGLAIFFTGFFWSRPRGSSTGASLNPNNPVQLEPNPETLAADANHATTVTTAGADAQASALVHVVIKNMKFDPPTVEVKSGDAVEWKNEDMTPHTATSQTFDSASIDPEKSWKHTFTNSGDFPYACTFHPDMKAVVIVR